MAKQQAPLDWRVSIVDRDGKPTASFQRLWEQQRSLNGTIPAATGDPGEFLNGDLTFAAVTDLNLVFTDNTHGNVSAAHHGFAPKAPGVATEYLDGTGAWSTPAGAGGGVTSVDTGLGLTGGPITTTGTISLDPLTAYTAVGAIAATALGGNRAVLVDSSGKFNYPSTTSLADGAALVGLTTGAISSGAAGDAQTSGTMADVSWAWTPGLPVYVGSAGALTQTPPGLPQVWSRCIGVAASATSIAIDIQPVIGLV